MHKSTISKQVKRVLWAILFVLVPILFAAPQVWANVLGNSDFEGEIGNGTGGNWDVTNGATRADSNALNAVFGVPTVYQGQFALLLNSGASNYTFQTFDHVKEGDMVSMSAYAESSVGAGGGAQGGQIVIEFKEVFNDGTDRTIGTVQSAYITTANADPALIGWTRFNISGIAPKNTQRVVFTLRTFGGAAGRVAFDAVNGEVNPAKLNVVSSKSSAKVGEPVAIQARFTNAQGTNLDNVQLFIDIPKGFDVVKDSVTLNGGKTEARMGSLTVSVGTVGIGQTINMVFVVVPTAGVTLGKPYDLGVIINNGSNLSDRGTVRLTVRGDPLFDEGTVIGKVFNDENQSGVQDCGEKGVPFVRIVTEEGIVVITDENGMYHIPNMKPGRHVIKIDGHTLPNGTKFITEEAYLIRTTPSIMNKANFAVLLPPSAIPEEFQKDLQVLITQGLDYSHPTLDVKMDPDLVKVGLGVLEKEPVFRFNTNYREFIKRWYLEIRDEMGQPAWIGFGVGDPPPEVVWNGQTDQGIMIAPGLYSYQLKVEDKEGHEDWTVLHFFRVLSKSQDTENAENKIVEIPSVGDFNIFKDGKQTIPLVAKPTIRIAGKTHPENKVTINSYPVTVDPTNGRFQTEVYTSAGEKEIVVTTATPEGETTTYREKTTVKDSMFFMTALGEEQMGVNFRGGSLETAGDSGSFKDGFYEDGRLSYYLMGKIKGKFLVKSHYDSSKQSSQLFTSLDPEKYYPVYGDASTRDYEAVDTQQKFFIVVEMERSFVKWGSFETEFNDTEMATYNRTLSGLKLSYETKSTSVYGDAKRGFKLFTAKAKSRADHNEFAATGGSLYYLRNRQVIEGSEKVRVEVRDKIQDMAVSSYDLKAGQDYEIDYGEGRMMLSRPLSSVAAADTLVSQDILDGNQVYLVVDYEYDIGSDAYANRDQGLRGYTYMGDHIRVGATAVDEGRQGGGDDYQMRGVDAQLKFGRNTKLTAEYAETINEQTGHGVSYNGGLSFANLARVQKAGQRSRQGAYIIKGESKPVKNVELSGFVQGVNPGFSTDRIRSQEGFQKYGVSAKYRLTDNAYLRYRYDHDKLLDTLSPPSSRNIYAPYQRLGNHTAQAVYDGNKWLGQAEYRRQQSIVPTGNLLPTLISEVPLENAVALKLGYHFDDRLTPYAKVQTTMKAKANHQFGGGVRYEVTKNLFAYIEQMIGTIGDSTYFGLERQDKNGARSYANLNMQDRGIGSKTLSTVIGSAFPLTQKSRIFSERQHSTYQGQDGYADIYGVTGNPKDHWDYEVKFERRHLDNSTTRLLDVQADNSLLQTNSFNTVSGAVGFAPNKKFRVRTSLEGRRGQDVPKFWQLASRNLMDYQITQDLSFRNALNLGISRFTDPDNIPADFMEFNTGFAFRPVEWDRLNALTRYTYARNIANDIQFENGLFWGLGNDETSHIVSLDVGYDINRYLGVVEKVAYKRTSLKTHYTDNVALNSFLWAHRFNFHVTRKWDVALEYRILWQSRAASNIRHGSLVEVDRELYDYVRVGVGYNFTDFDDDLRTPNSYDAHGPFVRLTGKF